MLRSNRVERSVYLRGGIPPLLSRFCWVAGTPPMKGLVFILEGMTWGVGPFMKLPPAAPDGACWEPLELKNACATWGMCCATSSANAIRHSHALRYTLQRSNSLASWTGSIAGVAVAAGCWRCCCGGIVLLLPFEGIAPVPILLPGWLVPTPAAGFRTLACPAQFFPQ